MKILEYYTQIKRKSQGISFIAEIKKKYPSEMQSANVFLGVLHSVVIWYSTKLKLIVHACVK